MKKLLRGFIASLLLHGLFYAGLLALINWQEARAAREIGIDLAGSSLLLRPHEAQRQQVSVRPQEMWVLAAPGHATPKPLAQAQPVSPMPEEAAGPVCPPPCPSNANDWLPAAAASRRPHWMDPISDDDYPPDLRRKGVEGSVLVDVLIDSTGSVRAVTLVQGSEPEFNQLVLQRLNTAKFQPAYDQDGNPIACRMRFNLGFKLKD